MICAAPVPIPHFPAAFFFIKIDGGLSPSSKAVRTAGEMSSGDNLGLLTFMWAARPGPSCALSLNF